MQKSITSLFTVFILSLFSATTVSAIEIVINSNGDVLTYQDGVLGNTTDTDATDLKPSPSTNISAEREKMLRIRNTGDQKSVEVINKDLNSTERATKIEAERLRLQMEARPKPSDASLSAESRAMHMEISGERAQESVDERQARSDENIELRRSTVTSSSTLELRSRNVRATIPEQRELVIDPETNEVGMVLPNGKIKILNHLPDQAQERIAAYVDNEELELTTLADGRVVYTTTVPKIFRMLGLFPRQIITDVTLDDSTGEVIQEKRAGNVFDRVLNAISF